MNEVRHISQYIARSWVEVSEFARDPRNLSRWASGLATSDVTKDGDAWVCHSPFGRVRVKFVEPNPFGVLDHDVTIESGLTIRNFMRVVPNGEGSEFLFTLIRRPGMSDNEWSQDIAAIESDLLALKKVLEGDGCSPKASF